MFDSTLLDSSPDRTPILTSRHWLAGLGMGVMGMLAGFVIVPMISDPSPRALVFECALLGVGVMFYELMIWYVLEDTRHLGLDSRTWSIVLLLLNVVGFVVYLIYSAKKTGDWKRATLPLAYIFQGVLVCVMLLVPLVKMQALPDAHRLGEVFVPRPPAGPVRPATPQHARPVNHPQVQSPFVEPTHVPPTISFIRDKPEVSQIAPPNYASAPWRVGDGRDGSGHDPILDSILEGARAKPPQTEVHHPAQEKPKRVGGDVEAAKLIFHPNPVYPELARMAHIQGTVVLEAIISREGTIENLKAVSGHPLLVPAAVDAVRRWRYEPTLLNREPVEVITEVDVNFKLNE